MRRIVMFNQVSADGAFAAPGGGLDWVVPDPELEKGSVLAMSGFDAMLFGSASLVSQLSEHGLIDEYQFVISPVLLGSGRPLLGDTLLRRKLELLEDLLAVEVVPLYREQLELALEDLD